MLHAMALAFNISEIRMGEIFHGSLEHKSFTVNTFSE
jgi:hypothetical protein